MLIRFKPFSHKAISGFYLSNANFIQSLNTNLLNITNLRKVLQDSIAFIMVEKRELILKKYIWNAKPTLHQRSYQQP